MKFILPSFKGKSVSEILETMAQVPRSIDGNVVDELDFSETGLFELNWDPSTTEEFMLPVNGMIEIINAIPPHILHLNLSNCGVAYANTGYGSNGRITSEQAELLYSAMGNPRFKEITFWQDHLGDMRNLAQLIGKLQQERVNLIGCYLWAAPSARLVSAAQAVSEKVTHLNISENGLHDYSTMKGFISALASKNLQEINVKANDLDDSRFNSAVEMVSIFSPLSAHCSINGIDIKTLRKKAAATPSEVSIATMSQEIENLASSIIKPDLRDDASLADCIKALTDLFKFTRSGMSSYTSFFGGADVYMQMKCAMVVGEVLTIQQQLQSITNTPNSEEVSTFLTKFAFIKTINMDEKIAEYREKLQDIVNALPAERRPAGELIKSRMGVISRQALYDLSVVYDDLTQRHEAGQSSTKRKAT